jgi:hypothetical protein
LQTGATRVRLVLLSCATLLFIVLGIARNVATMPEGLTGTYFPDVGWSAAPLPLTIDLQPSTDSLIKAWHGNPPQVFSATWIGSFVTVRPDSYTFGTVSDDGSWVYVDGRLVVDNGERHPARQATGTIDLEPGVHEVFVKYFQAGGAFEFHLLWARGGAPLEPVPSWALFPRRAEYPRLLVSVAIRRALPVVFWLWIGTLIVVVGASLPRLVTRGLEIVISEPGLTGLALIVAGSLVLNVIGIWWGLPSFWAGDEITPSAVIGALERRFTNGWFDRYPPFHFQLLSLVFSPWLVATSQGWIRVSDQVLGVTLVVLGRLVSVAAGAGTLIAIYVCSARAFGRRAGLMSAAMMALVPMFVFYSKTANPEMPYVFWFALSLVFQFRWLRTFAFKDIVLFALTATLAICTKDQAYALYLMAPFVFVAALWQRHRDQQHSHALGRALLDARLWAAAAAAVTLFAVLHNVAFNAAGFIDHVRFIAGPGSRGYRLFDPTLAGRLALLRLTIDLNQRSWGWPLWLVSLAGIALALREAGSRRVALCLLLVIGVYYLGFINVVLYNYDRYLLPVCAVEGIFGGLALDRFLSWSSRMPRPLRVGLVTGTFAYSLLYAATVDDLMVRDSRYTVEQWLEAHVEPRQPIGTVFPDVVLPRLGRFSNMDIGTLADLRRSAPAYYVLNADYARAVDPNTPTGKLVSDLQRQKAGYGLVFRYRSPSPWRWLPAPHPDLLGPRLDTPVVSFLRDINPTIEVFERMADVPPRTHSVSR